MTPAQFRAVRLCYAWSIPRMAADLGVHPSTVWRWEQGQYPVPERIVRRLLGLKGD